MNRLLKLLLLMTVVFSVGCSKDNKLQVVTSEVRNITMSTALGGGVVTTSGDGGVIIERGLCWGMYENPDITGNHVVAEGIGMGSFTCQITGLEPGTIYHVRAYAINNGGVSYGDEVSFKTLSEQPSGFSPSIAVLPGDEYVHDGDIINVYEEFNIGFVMSSNIESGKELASLTVVIDDETFETVSLEGTEYTYVRTLALNIRDDMTDLVITATVSDEAGRTASVTMTLIIDLAQELIPEAFEWNRHGGNPGTGLEEFGLQWNSNQKDICAVIEPVDGAELYEIPSEIWYYVTTSAEKAALFGEDGVAMPIRSYRGVSTTVNATYDDVIATLYNGEYHLIHVTEGLVYYYYGTDVTIRGEAK